MSRISAAPTDATHAARGAIIEVPSGGQLQRLAYLEVRVRWRHGYAAQRGFHKESPTTGQGRNEHDRRQQ